jgi:hypothetical protein
MRVSVSYIVVWQVVINGIETPYKFTKDGICINTQRCKILKKVSKNSTIGYNFNSKFYPLSKVRLMMQKIKINKLPF